MKIIHTSDWHLGHTLYGYDRGAEQGSMLEQIEGIVREERPDALVVSGDIFHNGAPSSAVQTLFTKAVMRMHEASPETVVIITAGNHDSAARHEISRVLWETQNVHMIGSVDKEDIEAQTIEIPGKGFVVAVPYINERSIPDGFWQGLSDSMRSRDEAVGGTDGNLLPVILSAHLTVSGSDFTGHEDVREFSVGGIDSVDMAELGDGWDYVALGHIHHAQTLRGSGGRVRYSGTPLPVSFDEIYPHSVTMVEIARHGDKPVISEIPIDNPHPLVTLPTEGFKPWEEVRNLVSAFPKDNPAYIRLNVEVEDILPPDAINEARRMLADGKSRFCLVNARRGKAAKEGGGSLTVSEFRAMAPLEVARMYAEDIGRVFDDEMEDLFREIEKEVRDSERKS